MVLLFMGISGAGKDTQADLLVKKYGFQKVVTGDLIRDYVQYEKTPLTAQVQKYYQEGIFLPDDLLFEVVSTRFPLHRLNQDIIFIGFIRRASQVSYFNVLLERLHLQLDYTVYFDLPQAEAFARLSSRRVCPRCRRIFQQEGRCPFDQSVLVRRKDDHPEAIRQRLATFQQTVAPIIKYYQGQKKLLVINALPAVPAVFEELQSKLNLEKGNSGEP